MAFPIPTENSIAVIFVSQHSGNDEEAYGVAARAMEKLAAKQPGYAGFVAARGPDGVGIAISYWHDEAAARAWRDQPDHKRIRDLGRERWYDSYAVSVAAVSRSYAWQKDTQ